MTLPEAELKATEAGLIPQGEGWFVLNARDASWIRSEERGQDTGLQGGQEWAQLGFRIQVMAPGQRGMFHGERAVLKFIPHTPAMNDSGMKIVAMIVSTFMTEFSRLLTLER